MLYLAILSVLVGVVLLTGTVLRGSCSSSASSITYSTWPETTAFFLEVDLHGCFCKPEGPGFGDKIF